MQRTDIVNPPEVRVAHARPADAKPQSTIDARDVSNDNTARHRFPSKPLLVALLLALLAIPASIFAYRAAHDGRVYRGVKVLGVDLGGMSRDEAQAALGKAAAGYPNASITVQDGTRQWDFAPRDLGLGVDLNTTVDAALQYGRSGDFMRDLGAELGALFNGSSLTPALKHDRSMVEKAVARVAADTDRAAVDSKLAQGTDGKVTITASSSGSVVDRDALKQRIESSLAALPFTPVTVQMRGQAPKVTEAALQGSYSQALALTEQPLVLKAGKQTWTVQPEELRHMLAIEPAADGGWTAKLDANLLAAYLKPIANEVRVDPVDASVAIGKGTVTLKKDVSGEDLDIAAAVPAIQQAASNQGAEARTVALPVKETPAEVRTADVQALYDKANTLVTQGIRLHYKDDGYILRGASVTGFIDVEKAQGGPGPLTLTIDDDVLADRISGVAYNINRQPTDARFRMVNGTPTKINSGQDGLKVNVQKSLDNARQAIASFSGTDRLQVDLDVAVTPANITDADMSTISTPDMLAYGQTSYAGSSAERAWNVGFGTHNLDGALVPPGGVFSVDDTIGPLTLDAGFKMGYAIVHTDKGLTTVPAEAGGICQVSTTLFHAVFRAGLPIVERHWHSYWIGIYGVAPTGLQGLDATISPPDLDFRWKNTTGNWILVKANADGKNVRFELWGTDPHWSVKIDGPVISNRVKTTTDMIYEKSDALPAGKQVLVEHAQDGFDSSIVRTVTDSSGNVIDKWTAKSHYQPAHNRTLIGTGEAK